MIDWEDTAIILGQRKHGENDLIITAFTRHHGRHSGLVKGGTSRRYRGVFESGNVVVLRWRARLEDHLGNYSCELQKAVMPEILSSSGRLAALVSLCGVLNAALPEREAHPDLYDLCVEIVKSLLEDDWAAFYADFERGLLESLGFGLHLDVCAATGTSDDLYYVSPKSGCAVSREAGRPYHERMLLFPNIFRRSAQVTTADVVDGLHVTGYFLRRHIFDPMGRAFPESRERLIQKLTRAKCSNGHIE